MTKELTRYQVQSAMAEWDAKLAVAEDRLNEAALRAALGGDGKEQEDADAEVRSIRQKLAGLERGLKLVEAQEREAQKIEAAKHRRDKAVKIRVAAMLHEGNVYAISEAVIRLKAAIERADLSGQGLRDLAFSLVAEGPDEHSREGGAIKEFLMRNAAFGRTDAAFRARKADYGDDDPQAGLRGRFVGLWEQIDHKGAWDNLARVLPDVTDEAVKEESRELAKTMASNGGG